MEPRNYDTDLMQKQWQCIHQELKSRDREPQADLQIFHQTLNGVYADIQSAFITNQRLVEAEIDTLCYSFCIP